MPQNGPPTRLRVEHLDEAFGIGERTPRLSWWLPDGSRRQHAYQLHLDGALSLESTWIDSTDSVLVPWPGRPLASGERVAWRVRVRTEAGESPWSQPAHLETGIVRRTDWRASWIALGDAAPGRLQRPVVRARVAFDVTGTVHSARLYATAHGLYEAFVNGSRVGDQELTPGFTAYGSRLQVQTYDVTELLVTGRNILGCLVSDGWFRGLVGAPQAADQWGDQLAVLAQLVISHGDGSTSMIGSGPSWRWSPAPGLRADLMLGQITDLTGEPDRWATSGFDDQRWARARVLDLGFGTLCTSPAPPIRRLCEVAPVAITRSASGAQVIDLGQNINGWLRLRTEGPAALTLTHREGVDPDSGEVTLGAPPDVGVPFDPEKMRRLQIDRIVTPAGAVVEPRHTVHGFRYVGVEGDADHLALDDARGIVVASDLRRTGWFSCSDERLNQLHEAARWSWLGNACDIPTDCPTRERSGWTGDFQVFAPAAAFLYDIAGFTTKWLRDLAAEQRADGAVANLAPSAPAESWGSDMEFLNASAGWGDAAVLLPWQVWRSYGDTRLVQEQWASMSGWLAYVERSAAGGRHPDREARGPARAHEKYLWDTGFHWGEWLTPDGPPADLMSFAREDKSDTATAYFAHSCAVMAQLADATGRREEGERFSALADRVRHAWCLEFLGADGRVAPATQANCVRALAFDLVPTKVRPTIAGQLAGLVRARDTHLWTGFLATAHLLPTLADNGHADLAFALLRADTEPSWLTMIDRGATTMWELWNGVDEHGWTRDSLNHYSKGAVITFLHRHVAGLRPVAGAAGAGYRHFEVQPTIGGGITWASARLDTPYGSAATSWQLDGDRFEIEVSVPPGTAARLRLPDARMIELAPGRHTHRAVL